jgi:uncharacterized protein YnzC (UPF0291/DUF896 family)
MSFSLPAMASEKADLLKELRGQMRTMMNQIITARSNEVLSSIKAQYPDYNEVHKETYLKIMNEEFSEIYEKMNEIMTKPLEKGLTVSELKEMLKLKDKFINGILPETEKEKFDKTALGQKVRKLQGPTQMEVRNLMMNNMMVKYMNAMKRIKAVK